MVQLTPVELRQLTRKTSNGEIITLICECLLKVITGNAPIKIVNIERFETAYKYLITPEASVVKKTCKRRFPFSATNKLFLLQVPHNLIMTA